jgi:hypothetical protein
MLTRRSRWAPRNLAAAGSWHRAGTRSERNDCGPLIAPSDVFVDAYVRGDYPEFAISVWLPAILHGVELVRSRRAIEFAQITLSYAGLVLTHVVTSLVFSGVPFRYALGQLEDRRSRALQT